MKLLKNIPLIVVTLGMTACGGSSSSSDSLTGTAQKGNFLTGSSVSFSQLSATGAITSKQAETKVKNDLGEFSTNLSWNDWTKITITGLYFNEFNGKNSTSELTLNTITDIGDSSGDINVNLFTHMVAARTEQLSNKGQSLSTAKKQALKELKALLDFDSNKIEKLNIGDNSKRGNAVLLLFSAGFLSATTDSDKRPTKLLNLADDFADNGLLDGKAKTLFKIIATYAGKPNVFTSLTSKLKEKGYKNPPNTETLGELPAWLIIDKNKNRLPIADSGSDKTITEGEKITLTGKGSDTDGTIKSYRWTQGNKVLSNTDTLVLNNLTAGDYTYTLTVTDDKDAKGSDDVIVHVKAKATANKKPTADAGSDKTITVGSNITLQGKGTDTDGTIKSYQWTQDSKVLSNTSTLPLNNLAVGDYTYTLTVTDDKDAKDSDNVIIHVKVATTPTTPTLKVNMHEERCVTSAGFHFKLVSTVTGGKIGSGPVHITRYTEANCSGSETALPSLIPSDTTATYKITNITSIGGGKRRGTMTVTVTVLGITQERSKTVDIDADGNVTLHDG